MYFLQGAQNILELWRKSTTVPGTKVHLFFLKNLFGMPSKCIEVYAADNSGIKAQPLPGSDVPPNRRIHHLTHKSMLQFMGGMGLSGWYERWAKIFYGNLDGLKITEEWTEMPDLMAFFAEQFGSSVIESMCGPLLRQINPSFMQDLKTYHYDQPTRTKGFPEWMIPKAYAVRRGILQNIKEWHATARMHCNKFSKEADYDLSWGSEFMRDRQEIFEGIDEFDHDAYASSDLGLIWT